VLPHLANSVNAAESVARKMDLLACYYYYHHYYYYYCYYYCYYCCYY